MAAWLLSMAFRKMTFLFVAGNRRYWSQLVLVPIDELGKRIGAYTSLLRLATKGEGSFLGKWLLPDQTGSEHQNGLLGES